MMRQLLTADCRDMVIMPPRSRDLPVKRPTDKYWELCMTINDSWGYQHNDNNYKSPGSVDKDICRMPINGR